jgi:hypothetical protein
VGTVAWIVIEGHVVIGIEGVAELIPLYSTLIGCGSCVVFIEDCVDNSREILFDIRWDIRVFLIAKINLALLTSFIQTYLCLEASLIKPAIVLLWMALGYRASSTYKSFEIGIKRLRGRL